MMHRTAARLGVDGGWHFVAMSRRGGHPIGYCAEHDPHATEAEARECYGRYLRDNVVLDGDRTSNWNNCSVRPCDTPARMVATIRGDGYRSAVLCPEHFTKEHAIAVMHVDGPACDSWES